MHRVPQHTLTAREWLTRKVVLPASDLIWNQKLLQRLEFLESAQWWDREAILAWQASQLSSLIQTAWREVPWYRAGIDRSGLQLNEFRTADKLQKLPVLTKADIRGNYPQGLTRPKSRNSYEVFSSGSTGTPSVVREDMETAGLYRASFMLALEWAGWHPGERHAQTGMNRKRDALRKLKDVALGCYYIPAFDLSDLNLDQILSDIDRQRINHLWGYPGSLFLLARRAAASGFNRQMKTLVTWGDNLYSHYRAAIESAFGTRVTDTYGCGEGFQIAAQCGCGDTYHVHDFDIVLEVVDDDLNPVPAGTAGHVLVTRLHPGPMPIIRYRVGDVAIQGGESNCDCKRQLSTIRGIQGRDTDFVLTPSGNRLVVHVFTGTLEYFPQIETFRVVQEELESIRVEIRPAQGFNPDAAFRKQVIDAIRKCGAEDLRISIEVTDEIPVAPSGKRRFIVSKIDNPRRDTANPGIRSTETR